VVESRWATLNDANAYAARVHDIYAPKASFLIDALMACGAMARALSARLSVMPERGNTTRPIGTTSSMRSVALERRGLALVVPVGLERDLGHLARTGPTGGYALGAAVGAAVQEDHAGVFGEHLIEDGPDASWSLHSMPPENGIYGILGPAGR
jgi:hypothetical protein